MTADETTPGTNSSDVAPKDATPAALETQFWLSWAGVASYAALLSRECDRLLRPRRTASSIAARIVISILGGCAFALLFSIIMLDTFFGRDRVVAFCLIAIPVSTVLLFATLRSGKGARWRTYLDKVASYAPPGHAAAQLSTIRLTPAGVEYSTDSATTMMRWNHFERIVCHNRFILFAYDGWVDGQFNALAVPFDAFNNDDQARRFFDAAKAGHDASDFSEEKRLVELLSTRTVHCPACGYTLAGVQAFKCPECGGQLSIGMIRLAVYIAATPRAGRE